MIWNSARFSQMPHLLLWGALWALLITDSQETGAGYQTCCVEVSVPAAGTDCVEGTLGTSESPLQDSTLCIPYSRPMWPFLQMEWSTWAFPLCCRSLRTTRRGWKGAARLSSHTADGGWPSCKTLNSMNIGKRSGAPVCGGPHAPNIPTSK